MIIAILVILGLCFGSFVNALVWRLRQQSLPKHKRAATDKDLLITTGRSMCPHCKHTLAWYDLLPVLSWIGLGGKCRYCNTPIGIQYPLVELSTAALFTASYVLWTLNLVLSDSTLIAFAIFGIWLVSLVSFMALIVYDIRWMLLPNKIVFPLIGLGAITVLLRSLQGSDPLGIIISAIGGLLVAGGIFYVVFQVSNGSWIGGGDVKLGFALGLFIGSPVLAFLMLFGASVLGLIFALPGVLLKKSQFSSKIPFGPFLIISSIATVLVGQCILDWYLGTVLYL